jgi:hypothetical protein
MVIAALLAAAVSAAPPSTDPYEIFAQARRYWESQRYPGQLQYTVVVRVHEGGQDRAEHYHSAYDSYSGTTVFDPVSDEELAHPHYPKGVNIGIFFWRVGKPDAPSTFSARPTFRRTTDSGSARRR